MGHRIAPVAVVRRVLLHKKTTIQTLIGAVTAYLLMAVAFTLIFLSLDGTQGSFFFGAEQPTTSFMYFSLVTITTTGYGDLAAVAPIGRMLATFEAVIGQVYLVTFVAMIVGRLVEQQARAGRTESFALDPPMVGALARALLAFGREVLDHLGDPLRSSLRPPRAVDPRHERLSVERRQRLEEPASLRARRGSHRPRRSRSSRAAALPDGG